MVYYKGSLVLHALSYITDNNRRVLKVIYYILIEFVPVMFSVCFSGDQVILVISYTKNQPQNEIEI